MALIVDGALVRTITSHLEININYIFLCKLPKGGHPLCLNYFSVGPSLSSPAADIQSCTIVPFNERPL